MTQLSIPLEKWLSMFFFDDRAKNGAFSKEVKGTTLQFQLQMFQALSRPPSVTSFT